MRLLGKVLGATVALAAIASGSAEAAPPKPKPKPKPSKGAPGPVAGAGLPFLAAAGIYWVIRRRMAIASGKGGARSTDGSGDPTAT
jgi:hypothetical protein